MTLTPRLRAAALGGGLFAAALAAYALAPSSTAPPEPSAPEPAEAPAPAADNVSPGVHGELMRLKADADAAPDDLDARLRYAEMALAAHRGADAAAAYETVVAKDPERRQAWLDLASAYGAAGDWDAVVDASERMLARFPADAAARYNAGAAHANAGRPDAARPHWQAVAEGDDADLAVQARSSLSQLDAMAAAGTTPATAPSASGAPSLSPGQTALPAGHPPLPSASGATRTADGVEARVVDGGAAPARTRALITTLAE